MANRLYEESYIQAIAEAIRDKNGSSSQTYKVSQMAPAIRALSTNGTASKPEEHKTVPIETNGQHSITPTDGYTMSQVTVDVQVPQIITGEFEESFNKNDTYVYEAENGKAFSKITINVNVPNSSTGSFDGLELIDSGSYGYDGDNITWKLYENGTLVMSGSGMMSNSYSDSPLKGNENIKDIIIEDGITSIGTAAFQHCTGLTNITIPNSVETISTTAFYNCSSLTSVSIPNTVTSIGMMAFANCSSLEYVNIPNGIKTIQDYTFDSCIALKAVYIPESIETIKIDAFCNCDNLTDVYYSGTEEQWNDIVIAAGNECFDKDDIIIHYEYQESQNSDGVFEGLQLIDSGSYGDNITWKLYENGTMVMSGSGEMIDASDYTGSTHPFYDNWSIINIIIEDGITSIGVSAFAECFGLQNVIMSDSVKTIGAYAFDGCMDLRGIVLSNNITSLDIYAFSNCCNMQSITIPKGVKIIKDYTFFACGFLQDINIPDGVTEIGERAFSDCYELKTVNIPVDVTLIKTNAFDFCEALTDVFYSGTKEQWDAITIELGNDKLKNATLHCKSDGINKLAVSIADRTITKITSEDFNGLTSIGTHAFYYCTKLKNMTLPETIISIGNYAFYKCDGFTIITIPNSVKSIGTYTFGRCEKLKNITLSNCLTSIGDSAFNTCLSLTSIEIPNSVTSIGSSAFYNCTQLTDIYLNSTTPPTLGNTTTIPSKTIIHVPAGSLEAYASATNWSSFAENGKIVADIEI